MIQFPAIYSDPAFWGFWILGLGGLLLWILLTLMRSSDQRITNPRQAGVATLIGILSHFILLSIAYSAAPPLDARYSGLMILGAFASGWGAQGIVVRILEGWLRRFADSQDPPAPGGEK